MDTAQRRVLGLVAIASWLLLDSVRTAGPLLSDLYDSSLTVAILGASATFVGGGLLGWGAAALGRHFGHGWVLLYVLGVLGVLRLGLPLLEGGWLVGAGLYLTAIAIAAVVLATRVALGSGGASAALAGTSLGAAAAVAEQTVLRTWDAVWRGDLLGWGALAGVAVLAIVNGWRCRELVPARATRGWWALGLHWSLLALAFANVGWINAQTELRMSAGSALAIVALCAAAGLAAQAHRVGRVLALVLCAAGIAALAVVMLSPGMSAAIALPIAVACTTLGAAQSLRPARRGSFRGLTAAIMFGVALFAPVLLIQLDAEVPLGVPALTVAVVAGAVVMLHGAFQAWRADARSSAARGLGEEPSGAAPARAAGASARPRDVAAHDTRAEQPWHEPASWIAPGVMLRVGIGLVVAAGAAVWTQSTFEAPRAFSADFIRAPYVTSWNVHYGVTPAGGGGPRVAVDEIAATITGSDVAMLQEVPRGWLLAGGVDMVEYLAGEMQLPYAYAPAHGQQFGNAILTSRPHADARTLALPYGAGPQSRSALAVDFMGATYATTHLQSSEEAADTRVEQVDALLSWLDGPQPTVVGGDFNDEPGSATVRAMTTAGFVSAQSALGIDAPTWIGSDLGASQQLRLDYVFGRGVEFTEFSIEGVTSSDHLPLAVRVATGAQAPTDADADPNEVQPTPVASPTPTASASAPEPSPSE